MTFDFEMEDPNSIEDSNESLTVTTCVFINEGDASSLTVTITD